MGDCEVASRQVVFLILCNLTIVSALSDKKNIFGTETTFLKNHNIRSQSLSLAVLIATWEWLNYLFFPFLSQKQYMPHMQ